MKKRNSEISGQEGTARSMAIARFEKGILLYYKYRYQKAIVEFQKIIDNYSNTVIDVTNKAKQYAGFCKDELRKIKPPLDMGLPEEVKTEGGGEMKEAGINSETSEIACPSCEKCNFTIFRRDKVSEKMYLNRCKCASCGQLFIYKVDEKNNAVLKNDIKKQQHA